MPIGEPAQLGRAVGTGSKQAVASTHPSTHTGGAQRPQSNASARSAGNSVRARGASSPRPNGSGASSPWGGWPPVLGHAAGPPRARLEDPAGGTKCAPAIDNDISADATGCSEIGPQRPQAETRA